MSAGLGERVRARGFELGFEAVGFAPAAPAPRAAAFRQWLDRGYAGRMEYLAKDPEERIDVTRRSPWARTIVSTALTYAPPGDHPRGGGSSRAGIAGLVARYAVGRDYHGLLKERLEELARFVRTEAGGRAEARTLVDTSAILERDHAAAGGLGWTGKNTMQLTESGGSYFFLGEILTDVAIEPGERVEDRCGSCTRCIDACPTGAIVDAWLLDARRCISYLTIELRGSIPAAQRESIGEHLFGCDLCQEVCPWNAEPPPVRVRDLLAKREIEETTLARVVSLDDATFRTLFRDTAILRAKRSGLVRNALIVAANRHEGEALRAGLDALSDPDPVVRETAVWALARGDPAERRAATLAAAREPDPALEQAMLASLDRS